MQTGLVAVRNPDLATERGDEVVRASQRDKTMANQPMAERSSRCQTKTKGDGEEQGVGKLHSERFAGLSGTLLEYTSQTGTAAASTLALSLSVSLGSLAVQRELAGARPVERCRKPKPKPFPFLLGIALFELNC